MRGAKRGFADLEQALAQGNREIVLAVRTKAKELDFDLPGFGRLGGRRINLVPGHHE